MTRGKSGGAKGMRFTRLGLANWRNFTDVDVALQGRVFLIGPNASGKSNLLDSIRFLHDLVAVGGGFEEAIQRRGGVSKLRCLAARRDPEVMISVTVGANEGAPEWRYELAFNQEKRSPPLIRSEMVWKDKVELLKRPDDDDTADEARLRQTHLEQINVNKEFRPLADFFRTIRYSHLVPQLLREPDRAIGRSRDPFGSDFLEQMAATPDRTRTARLKRISEALKVAVPQLQELEFYRDQAKGTPHLRGKYTHWRPRGAWQTEEQFSDGTLRLLGLLWVILDAAGPLLLEEPELSLHPEVIRHLPAMFARMQQRTGRQVLVSSHSADLLHDEGIGLDEVLVLKPETEGTRVGLASDFAQVRALVEGGLSLADAVLPETRPPRAEQLSLFGD